MQGLRPISDKKLKSSAVLYQQTGAFDENDNPIYGSAIALKKIYVEMPKRNALTSLGDQANDTLIVFYDCHKSQPANIVFKKGDKITYGGNDFKIREAKLLPNEEIRHHWELRLT